MNDLKTNLNNGYFSLKNNTSGFRDILLMHGFLLLIVIPLLTSSTKFILHYGNIFYLSFDNLKDIFTQHLFASVVLIIILLLIVSAVFFEFVFLLLTMYFIRKKQPIFLNQLLKVTFWQLRNISPAIFGLFLFYFFLLLPLVGISFNSDLLARVKISASVMSFIFTNRVMVIIIVLCIYVLLCYIGIRLLFVLPAMILQKQPFRSAIRKSLSITRREFISILGRFILIGGSTFLVIAVCFLLVLAFQKMIDTYLIKQALLFAVLSMTLLQAFLLLNFVLLLVRIFYSVVDLMENEGFLPDSLLQFADNSPQKPYRKFFTLILSLTTLLFITGVTFYNLSYLTTPDEKTPLTISHRGVSASNGVQNSLEALEKTHTDFQPDYVEMDVQQTSDHHFVVFHDFNLKKLTGLDKNVEAATLAEIKELTVFENGKKTKIPTFDEYLETTDFLEQKLLIEIKTQKHDVTQLVKEFLVAYKEQIDNNQHILQSMSFDVIEQLKAAAPNIRSGYILPFNVVGAPISKADFLTLESRTINRNFIEAAQAVHKEVFVWTPNDQKTIQRMQFYGVDGIVTDQMEVLNNTITTPQEKQSYSDKLLYFVIGIG